MLLFPKPDELDRHDLFTTNERTLEILRPMFFSPRMADCPQNPIMDGLKHAHGRAETRAPLPNELVLISDDRLTPHDTQDAPDWHICNAKSNEIVSWDSLHSMHPSKPSRGCLVSEQTPSVLASIIH